MNPSRVIYSICLLSLVFVCLCSTKVKASCSRQLGTINVPSQPQIPAQGQEPKTCVSNVSCCTLQIEGALKFKAVKDLKTKLDKRLDVVKRSTESLRESLKVYFQEIIQDARSENVKNLQRQNANISSIGIPLVTTLFNQVEDYIANKNVNLTNVVMQFFRNAFPPLFNYATSQSRKFSNQYEKCLKDKVNTIQLFGSGPYRIASKMEKVLKPMQVLLESLSFASKIIEVSKQLGFSEGCPPLLLQMRYCSLCKGESGGVKPCKTYCLDVIKSCLTTSMQLQTHWNVYFDALKGLSTSLSNSPNLKNVLFTVFNELSLAIYQAVPINIADAKLKDGLFQACGQPQYGSGSSVSNGASPTVLSSQRVKITLKEKMTNAKTKMMSMKPLYEELPHGICVLDRVAAPRTEKVVIGTCWNGTAMARYKGPVSSPLPSLEAYPKDTLRITNLVRDMKTNIKIMKKYTDEYDDNEGSAGSGDSNVLPGSGECDDDELCYSGSGKGENRVDSDDNDDKSNNDIYFSSTPKPDEDDSNDVQDGGQSNVQGSGKNSGTTLAVSSTLNVVVLSTVFVYFLSYRDYI